MDSDKSSNNIYGLRSNGHNHGDVFTSPDVVSFMLDSVGYKASRNLCDVSILEPSCGEGEFLVEIACRLKLSATNYGFSFAEAFIKNVKACEIDQGKVASCVARVKESFPELAEVENMITTGDFLLADFPKVDIVVGNPPYVRYEQIPASKIEEYSKRFYTFYYRADLYVLFFEKSLKLLNQGGLHCFICSNRWMKNKYGMKLRNMIVRLFCLESIINLEKADAFQEEVLAYPSMTLISNKSQSASLRYSETDCVSSLSYLEYETVHSPVTSDWSDVFCSVHDSDSTMNIESQGFKICIGVATGADDIFVSKTLPNEVEKELLLPALNAKDLRGNRFEWSGNYVLNPYTESGKLVDLDKYPLAKSYLEQNKERLASRHVAKKNQANWYRTIDKITPSRMTMPKILLPDISGNSYVFVDEGNFYPLHNLYYITGADISQLRLLSAILMSDFVKSQLCALANCMNGGYPRWQSQYLRKLRIPIINTLSSSQVKSLLQAYSLFDITAINSIVADIMLGKQSEHHSMIAGRRVSHQLTLAF